MAMPSSYTDESTSMSAYLAEIARYPLLTKADEVELSQRVEAGREAAAQLAAGASRGEAARLRRAVRDGLEAETEFVQANLRLVVSIAKKYQSTGLPLLDLIQEGNLGLMHAVEKFDWRKGFKFSTYATWWIRQSLARGAANTARTVRLPTHIVELVRRVQRTYAELEATRGRVPSRAEVAAALELTEARVAALESWSREALSLSGPLGLDGSEFAEVVADPALEEPDVAMERAMLPVEVEKLLGQLNAREQEIVRLRFGLGDADRLTLDQVGAQFGITPERVRQIEVRALGKLRHPATRLRARTLLDA